LGEIVFHSMTKLEAIGCNVIFYEEMREYIVIYLKKPVNMYYFEHVNLRYSVYLALGPALATGTG
jgi:hypothetical protein